MHKLILCCQSKGVGKMKLICCFVLFLFGSGLLYPQAVESTMEVFSVEQHDKSNNNEYNFFCEMMLGILPNARRVLNLPKSTFDKINSALNDYNHEPGDVFSIVMGPKDPQKALTYGSYIILIRFTSNRQYNWFCIHRPIS
jgi:hypothetical protein